MKFEYSPYRKLPGEYAEPTRTERPKKSTSEELNKLPWVKRVRIIFHEMEDMLNDAADKIRADAPDFPGAKDYIDYLRTAAVLCGIQELKQTYDVNHTLGIIVSITRRSSVIMQEVAVWVETNGQQGTGAPS